MPEQLLPDMVALADQNEGYIYDWRIEGDELRLTTAMANIGDGNMEVRGGPIVSGQGQVVYQRIYNDDGTFTDVEAGTFEYHSGHGHIHFEDFAHFRLREVTDGNGVGEIVAQGEKVSFCLIDVDQIDGSAGSREYSSCGQIQGVSAGWADVYSSGLPGQSIDITGVADGVYWLEVEVDPENRLIEADETNNVTRILINLDRNIEVDGDLFEDNDTFGTASILAPPEDHVYGNLSIHEAGDEDFYRFTASASGDMTFTALFNDADGDLDMIVYNESGIQLGQGTSSTDNESVTINAVEGENYVVRIYGDDGFLGLSPATNTYALEVDQPMRIDDFEPNDSFAQAILIETRDEATFVPDLSITPGNPDYFRLVANGDGTLKVHLDFENSTGDINARAYDSSFNIVAASLRNANSMMPNHEHLQWEAVEGESYYIHVFGADPEVEQPLYSMTIEQPPENDAPVAGDDTSGPILSSDLDGAAKINGTSVLLNDSDPDGDTVSISAIEGVAVTNAGWQGWRDASNGGQIVLNTDGRVQFRDRDGDFAGLPEGEQVTTSITYEISDGNGGTSTATVSFVIDGTAPATNVDPVAVDDAEPVLLASALADGARFNGENILANDRDANGDDLNIVEVNGAPVTSEGWQGWRDASNGGQISVNTDGRVQFRDVDGDFDRLPFDQVATTSITYTVSDGNGGFDTATISFSVVGQFVPGPNIAPDAQDDENGPISPFELSIDGVFRKINGENVLANDFDANGDTLEIVSIGGEAVDGEGWQGWRDASNGGQIVINTDGRVQFRDNGFEFAEMAPGEVVETSLDYTVSDGNGGTDTATVSFVISDDFLLPPIDPEPFDNLV